MVKSTRQESGGQGTLKIALIAVAALVIVAGGGWFLLRTVRVSRYIKDLDSESAEVRIEAVRRIAEYGPAAKSSVRKALGQKQGTGLAMAALLAGKLKDQESVPRLIELLSDSNAKVRDCAATALGKLRAKKAVDALANCLSDPEEKVRRDAAIALGRMGEAGKPGAAQLMKLLSSQKEPATVRRACARALGEIGAADAAGVLVKAITPKDVDLVATCAVALGKIGSRKAVKPLCSLLARGAPDEKTKKYDAENVPPKIRVAIIEALAKIGDRQAIPTLKMCADKKRTMSIIVREAAKKALQELGE
ncbi:MAG: HEAT repeat domain-containing protein [Planctomycetes bacterium]|nr:HEAT repeat domain-containing protein [Planctomycetota bacterium]